MDKKLTVLIVQIILLVSSTSAISAKTIRFNDDDFDPLVDLAVTVEIQQIRSLERSNIQTPTIEKIDWSSDPDFYVKIFINNIEFVSPIWNNTKYICDSQWSASLDIPDDEEFVDIKIQLWDLKDENFTANRLCDISIDSGNDSDSYDVELTYSIKTGHWTGDDFINENLFNADPSGYGRLNGCDDDSIYKHERDCELWFDIYQNDFDGDGIPYWTEVNVYGTNPKIDNSGEDSDEDGVPIEWEHKWGHYFIYNWLNETYEHGWIYDPLKWEDHANIDLDLDGLDNAEEYLTSQWYSDPFRQDIFLEIDQMEIGPNGEGSVIPESTKELLKTAFDSQNIVLHIDDGCMGGGQTDIPFDEDTMSQELKDIYLNFFLNGDRKYWRKGVFHYAVIVYHASYPGFVFVGDDRMDSLQISTRPHDKIPKRYPLLNRIIWADMDLESIRATVYASGIMHETGHTLGIFHSNTPGCDDQEGKMPWQINWWKWGPYKSCMNYRYVYRLVDYSNGSCGRNDFNDWGRMDLTRFQIELW